MLGGPLSRAVFSTGLTQLKDGCIDYKIGQHFVSLDPTKWSDFDLTLFCNKMGFGPLKYQVIRMGSNVYFPSYR